MLNREAALDLGEERAESGEDAWQWSCNPGPPEAPMVK
jgi:hypothetical protein